MCVCFFFNFWVVTTDAVVTVYNRYISFKKCKYEIKELIELKCKLKTYFRLGSILRLGWKSCHKDDSALIILIILVCSRLWTAPLGDRSDCIENIGVRDLPLRDMISLGAWRMGLGCPGKILPPPSPPPPSPTRVWKNFSSFITESDLPECADRSV